MTRRPKRNGRTGDHFTILIDGEITYHSPADYGDTEAQGEAPTSLHEFLRVNGEGLGDDEVKALKALKPGQSYTGGGGAAAEWTVTRPGGDECRVINVTYDIVTPESAEEGDVAERGWDDSMLITPDDLDEDDGIGWVEAAAKKLRYESGGSLEADSSAGVPRWFTETDVVQDRGYFERGEERRRSFHPEGFTDAEMVVLAKELGVYGFRKNKRGSRRPKKRTSGRAR